MKLRELVGSAVAAARSRDFRGEEELDRILSRRKDEYNSLDPFQRRSFDTERLSNPYDDARIILNSRRELRKVLVTLELDLASLLYAERLKQGHVPVDLVLGYDGREKAASSRFGAFELKEAALCDAGVDEALARAILSGERREAELALAGDAAGLSEAAERLELSAAVLKSPADVMAAWHLERLVEKCDAETAGALVEELDAQPEFKRSARSNARIVLASGSPGAEAGGIFFDVVGAEPLSVEALAALFEASAVRTVCMPPAGREPAEFVSSRGGNLLYLPPSAVRSLGMNVLLDAVDPSGEIDYLPSGGFSRHRRSRPEGARHEG